jgi:CBS-domain-containing membrane protein
LQAEAPSALTDVADFIIQWEIVMKVSDVMTRRVISISPQATILEAIKLMLKHHVSGLPVIDDKGKLVGIVTEGDFLRRSEIGTERPRSRWFNAFFGPSGAAKDYVRSHALKVQAVMTPDPVTVVGNTTLDEVVRLMEDRNIKRLPVMGRGNVVGIVSRANLMLALASLHRQALASPQSDVTIRDHILSAVHAQSWTADTFVDVTVRQGVANMWGTISDVAQREALRVLVESTPGVKRVEDHLSWRGGPISVT